MGPLHTTGSVCPPLGGLGWSKVRRSSGGSSSSRRRSRRSRSRSSVEVVVVVVVIVVVVVMVMVVVVRRMSREGTICMSFHWWIGMV